MSENKRRKTERVEARRPSPKAIISFHYLRAAIAEFITGWWCSRSAIALKVALPTMLAAIIVFAAAIWLTQSDRNKTLAAIEQRLAQATANDNLVARRICLNALCARAPDVPEYRFNLALSYAEEGNTETAHTIVKRLVKQHSQFHPGHLWLAELESTRGPAGFEQAVKHYQAVLQKDPDHAVANGQLGQLYARHGQPMLALDPLRKAAQEIPEAALMLANLLHKSGNVGEAARLGQQTATRFRQLVVKDPSNVELRVRWAEALRLTRQNADAEQVIRDGLALKDDPRLRTALSDLVVLSLQGEVARGIASGDRNAHLIQQAFHVAPDNVRAIRSLCQLATAQFVQCDPKALDTAVETIESRLEKNAVAADRLLLGWLRYLQKDEEAAVAEIESVATTGGSAEKLQLAILHAELGNQQASSQAAKLAEQSAQSVLTEDRSLLNAVRLAQVHIFETNWDSAVELLEEFKDEEKPVRTLIASVRLQQFDEVLQTASASADEVIKIATEVRDRIGRSNPAFVTRLSKILQRSDESATWANNELRDLLATGVQPGLIRSILGTHALITENFDEASTHLEFAFRAASDDPLVCNNLAYALTMRSKPEHRRAVELATQALTLLPQHPDVLETRARAYLGLKQYEEAIADLQFALPASPDQKKIHKLLATAYESLGKTDMSVRHRELSAIGG